MSTSIQMDILTAHGPCNLNRDDLGRNKTVRMGGTQRSRVSSQSRKRAIRCSDGFQNAMGGHIGVRTKKIGSKVFEQLVEGGIPEKDARDWARDVAGKFGKLPKVEKEDSLPGLDIKELAYIGVTEQAAIDELVERLIAEQRKPERDELDLLRHETESVDIALHGRMLAGDPGFNISAACQVSHSYTVHESRPEIDYFAANDDLNDGSEHSGAAHLGEKSFGTGVYYFHVNINRDLLIENLGGDVELANRAMRAFIEGVLTVQPTGMQNSFASRAHASYALVRRGSNNQYVIGDAVFTKAIDKKSDDYMATAILAIEAYRGNHDGVYDIYSDDSYTMNVTTGTGRLSELLTFVSE